MSTYRPQARLIACRRILIALLACLVHGSAAPLAQAQGIVGGAADGAAAGRHAAGPVGGVVGGVVGGAVGGAVGGVRGILGLPHRRHLPGSLPPRRHRSRR